MIDWTAEMKREFVAPIRLFFELESDDERSMLVLTLAELHELPTVGVTPLEDAA